MDREEKNTKNNANAQLNKIGTAKSLVELDNFLTQSMARQQIQALIKEEGLDLILQKVEQLANSEDESPESGLLVMALLGRLSAVARGRESAIFKILASTINATTLPALESSTLDGDGKFYAAHSLSQLSSSEKADYVLTESVALETAEKARKLLIELVLNSHSTAAKALTAHTAALDSLVGITNSDSRLRKARRISSGWVEVMRSRSFELGERPGEALVKWVVDTLETVDESWVGVASREGLAVILTGGGSKLAMVQELTSGQLEVKGRSISLLPTAAFPDWLRREYPALEDDFPRIAVSLGGGRESLIHHQLAHVTAGDVLTAPVLDRF